MLLVFKTVESLQCILKKINPDPNKQANKVKFFSRKLKNYLYSSPTFNSNKKSQCPHQKHLGIILDLKLDFSIHLEQNIKKCNKMIGLMRRLSVCLLRKALLTMYNIVIFYSDKLLSTK